jgi:hypothetical protein
MSDERLPWKREKEVPAEQATATILPFRPRDQVPRGEPDLLKPPPKPTSAWPGPLGGPGDGPRVA